MGTVLGRAGRVHINLEDYQVSVGDDMHDRARDRRPLTYSPCVAVSERPSVAFLMGREDVPCLRLRVSRSEMRDDCSPLRALLRR